MMLLIHLVSFLSSIFFRVFYLNTLRYTVCIEAYYSGNIGRLRKRRNRYFLEEKVTKFKKITYQRNKKV